MKIEEKLQSVLHHEIPITQSMGLSVVKANEEIILLEAPLLENINHKQSAFGGSLNTLATLAGWSLIWIHCNNLSFRSEIVIQSAKTDYKKAVRSNLEASCLCPNGTEMERFLKTLERRGKSRLKLDVTMNDGSVVFTGNYVVFKK